MKNILFIFLVIPCLGCNSKVSINEQQINSLNNADYMNSKEVILLKEQLEIGESIDETEVGFDIDLDYTFDDTDISVLSPIIQDTLIKLGYKLIADDDFDKRLYDLFKIKRDSYIRLNLQVSNYPEPIPNSPDWYLHDIYINPKYKVTFFQLFLPELIDYQKQYPQVSILEDTMSTIYKGDINTKITRWKDVTDLKSRRKSNWDILFHRNKYLFNDSNASLTWLMNNDKIFLESLVTIFGYVQNEKLLKWVIDNNLYNRSNNNLSTVSAFLTNMRCDGTWVFNQEALNIMDKYYKEDYYSSIMDFVLEYDNKQEDFDMPFPKKAEMIAKLLSWIESKADMNNHEYPGYQMGTFFYASNRGEKFEKEFEKHDYYNLPNLEQYWEAGKDVFK